MAQLQGYHVRNWDKYYGGAADVECARHACLASNLEQPRIVVELCVPGCCARCNQKLADGISFMDGFQRLDFQGKKLTVIGTLKAEDVLKACKKVKKSVKLWPQQSHPPAQLHSPLLDKSNSHCCTIL